MFQYQSYVPDPAAGNSEFLLGATTNCLNAELCGLLTPLRVVSIRNLSPAPWPCARRPRLMAWWGLQRLALNMRLLRSLKQGQLPHP